MSSRRTTRAARRVLCNMDLVRIVFEQGADDLKASDYAVLARVSKTFRYVAMGHLLTKVYTKEYPDYLRVQRNVSLPLLCRKDDLMKPAGFPTIPLFRPRPSN